MPNPRVSSLLQSRQLKKEDNHTLLATAHHYGSSSPNAFAPAIFHSVACSAISCRMSRMSGWQPSKTQRLRSFPIDQDVRMTKEFSPFLAALGTLRAAHLHQYLKMSKSNDGARCSRPIFPRTAAHTCLVKTQEVRMC